MGIYLSLHEKGGGRYEFRAELEVACLLWSSRYKSNLASVFMLARFASSACSRWSMFKAGEINEIWHRCTRLHLFEQRLYDLAWDSHDLCFTIGRTYPFSNDTKASIS